jgi:hypothetical protein
MPFLSDLRVTVCGLATSLLVAGLLFWVESLTGFSLYSWSVWFIVPAGAFLSGFAAASGYYFGAMGFNQKPSKGLMVTMVLVSGLTFVVIYYLGYYFLQVDGLFIREKVSFLRYLPIVLRGTSITVYNHGSNFSTGELGWGGFVFAALQILGFSVGGLAIYGWLVKQPYCDNCARYLSKIKKLKRFHGPDLAAFDAFTEKVRASFLANDPEAALSFHGKAGEEKRPKGSTIQSAFDLRNCRGCGKSWTSFSVHVLKGNDWSEVEGLRAVSCVNRPVALPQ